MEDDEEDGHQRRHSPNPNVLGPSNANENRRPPVIFTPGSRAWARPYRLQRPNLPKLSKRKHGFAKVELINPSTAAVGDDGNGFQNEKTIQFHCHCGKVYSQRSSLANHVGIQKNGKVFKCPHFDCSKRYKFHQSLIEHVRKKHKIEFDDGLWCHGCGKRFKTWEDHRIHRKNWHPSTKLGKPKIGLPPSPKQPAITRFFRATATTN